MMDYKEFIWWKNLSGEEKEVLIRFLYGIDLEQYINISEDGRYLGVK